MQWLRYQYPREMLQWLYGRGLPPRKFQLYAASVCRRSWDAIQCGAGREAVIVLERFAEGEETDAELSEALHRVQVDPEGWPSVDMAAEYALGYIGREDAVFAATGMVLPSDGKDDPGFEETFRLDPSRALWEIFGNPFKPICPPPHSRLVLALAKGAYAECLADGRLDCHRLAVLADAVEEAGCCDQPLLAHLRSPGPHYRGCWLRFVDCQYRPP
ncbi:MAG TPA: hypothetical protein VKV02_01470 [Acidobacteriaceae bacterium]|nr:hypothetical protein [Acidobacteriaceae bacterium]